MQLLRSLPSVSNACFVLQCLSPTSSSTCSPLLAHGAIPDCASSNVTEGDGRICIWDCESGRLLNTISAHRTGIVKLALNAETTMLASASLKATVVRIFSVPAGECLHSFRHRYIHSEGPYPYLSSLSLSIGAFSGVAFAHPTCVFHSLSFCESSKFLLVCSSGTRSRNVNLFSLEGDGASADFKPSGIALYSSIAASPCLERQFDCKLEEDADGFCNVASTNSSPSRIDSSELSDGLAAEPPVPSNLPKLGSYDIALQSAVAGLSQGFHHFAKSSSQVVRNIFPADKGGLGSSSAQLPLVHLTMSQEAFLETCQICFGSRASSFDLVMITDSGYLRRYVESTLFPLPATLFFVYLSFKLPPGESIVSNPADLSSFLENECFLLRDVELVRFGR